MDYHISLCSCFSQENNKYSAQKTVTIPFQFPFRGKDKTSQESRVCPCPLPLISAVRAPSWILDFMLWKQQCLCWNRTKFSLAGNYEDSPRDRKNNACKFVRNYWTHTRHKVAVSWITSLTVLRHGDTTTRWSKQPESMERQHDNSLSKKKFERQPSPVKLMCTGFWHRKGEILPVLIEPR